MSTDPSIAGTILLVDDSPASLALATLEEAGYRVAVAANGEEALQRAALVKPDLILLDVIMPGQDGYEVCRRLKAQQPTDEIPIIFLTASTETFDKVKGFALGAVDYLIKPLAPEELLARVRTHVTMNRLERELRAADREERVAARTAELATANEALRLNAERMETLLQLNQMTGATLDEIIGFTLEAAVRVTRSKLGYVGFMNEDETVMNLQLWSRDVTADCRVPDIVRVFPVETAGLWAEAVRQRRPIITNDYAAPNPWKKRTPEGHVRITRHMNVPLIVGGKIVLVAGVGNKEQDYTEADVNQLTLLMEGMWRQIERKRVEDALRDSEEKYRRIVDTADEGIWVIGPDTLTIFVNPTMENLLGYAAAEMLGHPFTDFMFAEDVPDHQQKVAHRRQGLSEHYERRFIRKDGRTVWTLASATPILDEQRRYQGSFVMLTDITERRMTEERLFRLNRELRAIGSCHETLLRVTDEQRLISEICRIICEEAGYRMAWVGYAEHDVAKSVRPVAWAGVVEGSFAASKVTWADMEYGQGAVGSAIRSGATCCVQDIATDPRVVPWREGALQCGYRSHIGLPLKDEHANTFGSLIIYSAQPNAFAAEEIRLLEGLAGDLAFGIAVVRARIERERAEESLALRSFALDNVREAAFLIDELGRFHYVNEESCRVLGYAREELLGLGVPDIDPDLTAERWPGFRADLKEQRSLTFESRHRAKDGRVFPVEISANYFEYGGKAYDLAFVRDITERKRREHEQQVLAHLFQVFLLHSTDEMYAGALEVVLDAFRSDLGIFGYINEEGHLVCPSMTRKVWDQCQVADKTYVFPKNTWGNSIWGNALRTGEAAFSNTPFRVPQGHIAVDNCLTVPIVFRGESIGLLTVANKPGGYSDSDKELLELIARRVAPVLEARLGEERAEKNREAVQAQLAQSQKMESVGRLAGGVAHDFNNLLTVINGYSKLAMNALRSGDPLRDYLGEIHKAGERAAGLTQQLLAFSRKQVLQPRTLDLNSVVESMRSMLQRLMGEDVELRFALSGEAPVVHADPHQLEQVVMNLAVNARDAMPSGGRLLIETGLVDRDDGQVRSNPDARAGRYARLAVSDTGEGMDEVTRLRIFEPFFTTKASGRGTGLGLSMVQGIVAQSGGYISVYSEPGHGTTFRIYLPAQSAVATAVEEPASVVALRGNETILVVEDQAEVRSYAVVVLEGYGYRVMQAANAGEALVLCERAGEPIHLVLADVVMPHMNGRELVNRLTIMRPGIKALFMSGYTDNVIVNHGVLDESAPFIEKPFSPEALARKVRAVLGPPMTTGRRGTRA